MIIITLYHYSCIAWSISLHPDGETFAATGGSGNVTLHSANPTNFGDRLAKLESGRAKMGMCTVYVS